MPNPPTFDSFSPLTQIAVLIASTVAGLMVWMFGSRSQPANGVGTNTASIISQENEKLRRDLEQVLSKHREAIDVRFQQQADGIAMVADSIRKEMREIVSDMHEQEVAIARLETRDEDRRRGD